jgi:hypothetical protein
MLFLQNKVIVQARWQCLFGFKALKSEQALLTTFLDPSVVCVIWKVIVSCSPGSVIEVAVFPV